MDHEEARRLYHAVTGKMGESVPSIPAVGKRPRRDRYPGVGPEAEICIKCFELRGEIYGWHHLCDCEREAYRAAGREVPRCGDLSNKTELCRCCALYLIPSRSRWSSFFCPECKERVFELNRRAGRCVIPVGRHSIMNGVFYKAGDHDMTPAEAIAFYDQVTTLFHQADATGRWRGQQTARNIGAIGLAEQGHVPLRTYLRLVRRFGLSTEEAFKEMRAVAHHQPT
jgi:hypothetical protein